MQCRNILSHCVSTLSFKYPQNILYFGHFSALFTVTDSKEFFSEDLNLFLFGTLMQILCKIQIAKMIMIQIHSSELFLREKGKNYVNSDQNTEYFEDI